jgi:hypothetical protein
VFEFGLSLREGFTEAEPIRSSWPSPDHLYIFTWLLVKVPLKIEEGCIVDG